MEIHSDRIGTDTRIIEKIERHRAEYPHFSKMSNVEQVNDLMKDRYSQFSTSGYWNLYTWPFYP